MKNNFSQGFMQTGFAVANRLWLLSEIFVVFVRKKYLDLEGKNICKNTHAMEKWVVYICKNTPTPKSI
jgi:hypothetical protein